MSKSAHFIFFSVKTSVKWFLKFLRKTTLPFLTLFQDLQSLIVLFLGLSVSTPLGTTGT